MSLQFKYSDLEKPSAPIIDIIVSNKFGKSDPRKGKIDTGSSLIAIPSELVEKLELKSTGKTKVGGYNTPPTPRDTFHVRIKVGSEEYGLLKATTNNKSYVLLGRNLINLWKLILDGENTQGEIIPWSTNPNDAK